MSKYKVLKIKGRTIGEHRFLMQQKLGRKLRYDECVHHINGDKSDNRIENLEVVNRREHSRQHRIGNRLSQSTITKMTIIHRELRTSAKLSIPQVIEIKNMLASGRSTKEIQSVVNGISKETVSKIRLGTHWNWVQHQ